MVSFSDTLERSDIDELLRAPKSDIHTHGGKGGRLKYYSKWADVHIDALEQPFENLDDMQKWFNTNIKIHDNGKQGYLKRIEASFVQAAEDNIVVLALSFGIEVIDFLGGIDNFIHTLNLLNKVYAPETKYYPELSLARSQDVNEVYNRLDEILCKRWFKSIDICGDEFAQPIKNFQRIYKKAQSNGIKLKAHVGEFGTADDVREAIELLELSEVHHGIAAAKSQDTMRWLSKHKIQLNICPTSNIMLNRVRTYTEHPIKILFENEIPVTINTDDLLIFNSSVSEEYLKLYNNKTLSIKELEIIRKIGLKSYG